MAETLADMVFWLHMGIIVVLVGGFPALLIPGYVGSIWNRLYNGLVFVTLVSQIMFGGCPLVLIEKTLRMQYDPNVSYYGTFTAKILNNVFGIQLETTAFTAMLVIIGLSALVTFFIYSTREKKGTYA